MADNPFQKYASQPSQGTVWRDPTLPAKERRAEEDQANEAERLRLAREEAARNAVNDEISRQEKIEKIEKERADRDRLERAQGSGVSDALYQIRGVIQAAKDAKAMAASGDGIGSWEGSEGFRDSTLLSVFGANSASNDMEALLNTIGSNTAFDRLQKMRDESPTGGALGAVSEVELRLLRDSIASLSQKQSEGQFKRNMQNVIDAYTRVAGKLDAADRYYRENGSLEGFTPPSEEELAQFSLDGTPPPSSRLAGSGATQESVPIPQEYQDRHAAYLAQNWGNLTPEGYSKFRAGLDNDFPEVGTPDLEAYRSFAEQANEVAAQGGSPADVGAVPAVSRDMSWWDQAQNNFVTSQGGTALANALDIGGAVNAMTDGRVQALSELNPGPAFVGDMISGATGAGMTGKALSLAPMVGSRAAFLGDALYGTVDGAMSDDDMITGALTGLTSSIVGDQAGKFIGRGVNSLRMPEPELNAGQRAIAGVVREAGNEDEIAAALTQARDLGVPMTLADASPELQSLAGSTTRFSPTVAGQARSMIAQRNEAQMDRLAEAVARDLGPVENIPQLSDDLIKQARAKAGPLYDKAYAQPGAESVEIADLMRRPSFQPALREAYKMAQEEGVDPNIYGFVMDEAGEVNIDPSLFGGRYSRATVNAEKNFLQPRSFTSWTGRTVNKQGPVDLVGWLRLNGGLADSGGELAHMGLTNRARGRMGELVGREAEFGPLVNADSGMDFDTAVQRAWEDGYFPEFADRPDINTFLNALRDTADGVNQRFAVDDLAEVESYRAALGANNEVRAANGNDGGLWDDMSEPAGWREFAPLEAYGQTEAIGLSWEALDQVKRGLDSIIETNTDPIKGLNSYGRSVLATKNELLKRMDAENWHYDTARRAYAGPMQERDYLQRGVDAFNARPDQLGVDMAGLTPEQQAQMRLGYQSEIMGRAGNLRNNSNPWAPLNTPNTEGRLNVLYGSAEDADIARLLQQRDLELQLAGSGNRLVGNSATAERMAADDVFASDASIGSDITQGIAETALLGGPFLTVGKSIGDRIFKERRERAAVEANRKLADEIGPLLFEQTPPLAGDAFSDMMKSDADYQAIVDALLQQGDAWGRRIGTGFGTAVADNQAY